MYLLTLTHTNRLGIDEFTLGQLFDECRRIRAHRQEADKRCTRVRLFKHAIQIEYNALDELFAYRVRDIFLGLGQSAVGTPRANQQEFSEDVQRVVVAVGYDLVFGRVFVKPLVT